MLKTLMTLWVRQLENHIFKPISHSFRRITCLTILLNPNLGSFLLINDRIPEVFHLTALHSLRLLQLFNQHALFFLHAL